MRCCGSRRSLHLWPVPSDLPSRLLLSFALVFGLQPAGSGPAARRVRRVARSPGHRLLDGADVGPGLGAQREARKRIGLAEVRRGHGLPALGAGRAGRAGRVADDGLLADQLSGVADPDAQPARGVSSPTRSRSATFAAGRFIEVAAQDPAQGVVFYEIAQDADAKPHVQAQQRLPRVSPVLGDAGRSGADGAERLPAARRELVRQRLHDRSRQSARAAMGWLVGDRRSRRREAHRQRVGDVQRQGLEAAEPDAPAAVARRTLRPEGLSHALQRRRGAAGHRRIRPT